MATQAQQTELLTLLVGMFDAAPTAELFNGLVAGLDAGATVDQYAEAISTSSYFTGLYADTEAFAANFGTALVGEYVSEEVLAVANQVVAARLEAGDTVADVIAFALTALSSDAAANSETWGAAAAALSNKVEVAQYFVDNVSGSGLTTVAEMQAILAGVTEDAATVTAAQETIDTDYAPAVPGETFTLTTGNDAIESGENDDTINGGVASDTASAVTLNASDIIIDASTEDNDTLNIVWSGTAATAAAQIKNIENINVDINEFIGIATTFNATNVTGATVTFSTDKLGADGVAGATGVANNAIVAGDGIKALTVAGLTGGSINAGSASTVTMDGTASRANTVTVNGDLTLNNTASTLTTLDVTAASKITYDTGAATIKTTVTGAADTTFVMASADVIAGTSLVNEGTGSVTLDVTGATFDTTNFDADKILVGSATAAATVASGQTLETKAAQTSLTVATTATTDTTATVIAGHDIATLVVSDDKLDTTINATRADGLTISTLTGTGEDVSLTGSVDVTVTSSDVASFDASAFTGDLTYTTVAGGTTQSVTLGSGTNKVTSGDVADKLTVTGSTGKDSVVATGIQTGIINVALGAGDDSVQFNTLGAATIAMDGGAGTDTIKITNGGSTTAATVWAVQNFETIEVVKAADDAIDALTVSMNASQLSGQTYTFTQTEALDTLTLTVAGNSGSATSQTIDLSGITMQSGDSVVINGEANVANTIVGTNVKDTITAGAAASASEANVLTGGAGDDTFVFAADASLEVSMAKITDYQAAAATSDNDTLDLTVTTTLTSTSNVDDIANSALSAGVKAIFAGATNAVDIAVSDSGIMTLVGTASDVALANSLAEYIDIAEAVLGTSNDLVAFQYNGNTYVLENDGTDTSAVIELTGVTGITGISTTAAADTILVA